MLGKTFSRLRLLYIIFVVNISAVELSVESETNVQKIGILIENTEVSQSNDEHSEVKRSKEENSEYQLSNYENFEEKQLREESSEDKHLNDDDSAFKQSNDYSEIKQRYYRRSKVKPLYNENSGIKEWIDENPEVKHMSYENSAKEDLKTYDKKMQIKKKNFGHDIKLSSSESKPIKQKTKHFDSEKEPEKESKRDSKKEPKKESKKESKKEPKKESKKEPNKESKKDPKKDPKKEPKKDPKKEPKKDPEKFFEKDLEKYRENTMDNLKNTERSSLRNIQSLIMTQFQQKLNIWEGGVIPYHIDAASFSEKVLRDKIRRFLQRLNADTCVKFVELPSPPTNTSYRWVYFVNRQGSLGCADHSIKSFTKQGVQTVHLNYDCIVTRGELAEAVMSILGIPAQHNAPNRDNYIIIHMENIMPDKRIFFERLSDSDWLFDSLKYDFKSITHYDPHKYSANGRATFELKNNSCTLEPDPDLSDTDLRKIKILYNYITKQKRLQQLECQTIFKSHQKKKQRARATALTKKPRKRPELSQRQRHKGDRKRKRVEKEKGEEKRRRIEEILIKL